jgi:uncharacterized protein YkwD
LRKAAAALLSAPVVLIVYLEFVLRRSVAARIGLLVGIGAIVGVAAIGTLAPEGTSANPSGADPTALPSAAFTTHVVAGQGLRDGVTIAFSEPMDASSVQDALVVQPSTPVELTWDVSGTELSITPAATWTAGTYYVVTVGVGARDRDGSALGRPARAAFLTRGATTALFGASGLRDGRVPLDTRFMVTVAGTVDWAELSRAVTVSPAVAGKVEVTRLIDGSGVEAVFHPDAPLPPDTVYTVSLAPDLADLDGGTIHAAEALEVRTVGTPSVVRFRPFGSAKDVARTSDISVRFSQPMDRETTEAAFEVVADGAPVKGELRWYEDDTVLLLDPTDPLPEGATVTVRVRATASSTDGVTLDRSRSVAFTTVKPAPKATPKPTPRPTSPPSVGGSSWSAVESYYLKLLNCTRGGGLVTSSGGCSSPGGSGLAPLKLSSGLTTKVARPYAKKLAVNNVCSHTYGSTLASRLKAGGYTGFTWAGENLGCRSGDPYAAVLASHLFFQSERTTNGGHWRNIMDKRFSLVGIGVWVSGGRVRLVTDFYAP